MGMLRSALGKVAWVGRTASMVFGLALVMALVIGAASTAWSATGGNFILGKANGATTVSKLTASIAGPALTLVNNSTAAAATALNISVASGKAPLKVNAAAGTATNLSADKIDGMDSSAFYAAGSKVADSELLDGKDSTEFANASHPHSGADITTGTVAEPRIDALIARDSEVVNRYMEGRGHARHGALALAAGTTRFFFDMPSPGLVVMYTCPTDLASNGQLSIRNNGSETVNLFSDNGSTNPNHFGQLAPNQTFHQGAAAGGEFITLQVQGSSVTTIDVFSAHRSNDCHVQAQGIATRP